MTMSQDPSTPRPRPERVTTTVDDRAVSTAVTHVLAIGITTILISGLLVASASLLTGEQDSAGRTQLQEIGNRVAEQIYAASVAVDETGGGTQRATVRVDQPSRVSGYSYVANLYQGDQPECDDPVYSPSSGDPDHCLVLDPAAGLEVQEQVIPVDIEGEPGDYAVELDQTSGGEFTITVQQRPLGYPAAGGCGLVDLTQDPIKVDGVVVNCDIKEDSAIRVENGGGIIGTAISTNDQVRLLGGSTVDGKIDADKLVKLEDGSEVDGDITAERNAEVLDGSTVDGSITSENKQAKVIDSTVTGDVDGKEDVIIDNGTVRGDVYGDKVIDIDPGSTVGGDVVGIGNGKVVNIQDSTVEGAVANDGTVKPTDSTIEGDVYADSLDCTGTVTINGQPCSNYSPKDPDDY